MHKYSTVLAGIIAALSSAAFAQSTGTADDMVNQLLPASPKVVPPAADRSVLSVQAATKDEMVGRLSVATRSLDPKASARPLVLAPGHEAQTLATLEKLPSMQVAVAFQGSSDALAPEAGALLGTLSQALSDPKLASSRFVIGVHTNSVGSDDYNLSLSSLRARAIADTLVSVHGLAKDRLVPIGFGRLTDESDPSGTPAERIRIVNLGDTAVGKQLGTQALVPAPIPGAAQSKPVAEKAVSPAPVKRIARKAVVHRIVRRQETETWHAAAVLRPSAPARRASVRQAALNPRETIDETPVVRRRAKVRHTTWSNTPDVTLSRRPFRPVEEPQPAGLFGGFALGGGGGSVAPIDVSRSSNSTGGGGSAGGGGGGGGGSSSGGGTSGGGGGGGGGGWSDRRLKRSIRRIGRSARGYAIYSFQYVWGGPFYVGVMAQEIQDSCPEAIIVGPGGYLQVDYSKLDVAMMTLQEWNRRAKASKV